MSYCENVTVCRDMLEFRPLSRCFNGFLAIHTGLFAQQYLIPQIQRTPLAKPFLPQPLLAGRAGSTTTIAISATKHKR